MLKKLSLILGIAIMLSSMSVSGMSQTDSTEHHTGVKRTYHKAKHTVKKAWKDTKATTSKTYNKAKTRVTTDDSKKDAQEAK
jgi:hypothetical protein